ncbi:hypothetical protein F2Q69_00058444 [Brassica cretica]|uniref:Uncharacterized protein n=1 Tax=Brassica cretica TaxID=69181 RepID=A0A8S9RPS2_BRACR|nr:hypothetical protein F2Q69_00058444 [Brassica cretica]
MVVRFCPNLKQRRCSRDFSRVHGSQTLLRDIGRFEQLRGGFDGSIFSSSQTLRSRYGGGRVFHRVGDGGHGGFFGRCRRNARESVRPSSIQKKRRKKATVRLKKT